MLLVLAVLLGLIPAFIAQSKGHSFGLWWVFGAALFIIALPCAIVISPREDPNHRAQASGMKTCPFCAELVQPAATVCKHCGRDIGPSGVAAGVAAPREHWVNPRYLPDTQAAAAAKGEPQPPSAV